MRSTLSNYLGKVVTLGVGFLLTPFMLHRLGAAEYGLWILVSSLVGYGALLDLGLATAVTKYVAEYRAKDQTDEAARLVATVLCLYLALGLAAIGLSALLAPIFPDLFHLPPEQHARATRLVLLSGVSLGLSIPSAITSAILWGLQRFDLANGLGIVGTLMSGAVTVVILVRGGDVLDLVAAGIVITLLMQFPAVWIIRRVAPELHFGWRGASRQRLRTVFSFSASLFLMNVAGRLQSKTDEIVIGAFLPILAVTPYAIARRLSDMGRILTEQFMKVLLPLASELHAENDQARLRTLYIVSTRLTLASFLAIGAALVTLASALLTLWVGPEYARYAYLVLILTVAGLIDTSLWPAGFVLQGMARHQRLAVIAFGSGVANLALSIHLLRPLGLTGVALGTLIPTTLEAGLFVLPYTLRVIGISLREALTEIWLPSLLPAIPTVLILLLMREMIQPTSLLLVGLEAAIGLLVYVLGYLSLDANHIERKTSQSVVHSAWRVAETCLARLMSL
jgi:O-antigen/teichoic acid export membrane protein